MKYYLLLFSSILGLQSCFLRAPSLSMTDKYMTVVNPGDSWFLAEVQPVTMDSAFNYPADTRVVLNYNLVKRRNNASINGNKYLKINFNKRYARYKWMYYYDYKDRNHYFSDTLALKPFTWYNLFSRNYGFEIYFYWNGKKNDYTMKVKPKPGAW